MAYKHLVQFIKKIVWICNKIICGKLKKIHIVQLDSDEGCICLILKKKMIWID